MTESLVVNTSLALQPLEELTKSLLGKHAVTYQVKAPTHEPNVLTFSPAYDLVRVMINDPLLWTALVAGAFTIAGKALSKALDTVASELAKDSYTWFKELLRATLKAARERRSWPGNPLARTVFRVESFLGSTGQSAIPIVLSVNHVGRPDNLAMAPSIAALDGLVTSEYEGLFVDVVPMIEVLLRQIPFQPPVNEVYVEANVVPGRVDISLGHNTLVTLRGDGQIEVPLADSGPLRNQISRIVVKHCKKR